jgi:hypothetical protein
MASRSRCYAYQAFGAQSAAMVEPNDLLQRVVALLQWHVKSESIAELFTRSLHEKIAARYLGKVYRLPRHGCIPGWAGVSLEPYSARVIAEEWSLDKLTQQFPLLWHERAKPVDPQAELIIFRGWGHTALIDGSNRLNLWQKIDHQGPHHALVVEPLLEYDDPFPQDRIP